MRRLLACCAASWMAAVPLTVHAAEVITFTSIAGASGHNVAGPYVEKGMRFAMANGASFFVWGTGASGNADPGGATLTPNAYGDLVLTSVGGSSFDLASFDVADRLNNGSGGPMLYSYTTRTGSGGGLFNLDLVPGLQTVTLNLTDLTRFTIQTTAPGIQLDNVRFTPGASGVPEPASWALMISGFGLVGGALRGRLAGRRATA